MSITPTTWLQEFITNLVTANNQANPRVVALANGNFLVVWEDDSNPVGGGAGTDIVGVIFNALGQPITGSLFLNNFFGFSRNEVLNSVAATPDGGFVMVYTFPNADDTDLIFGIYDATGFRTVGDFAVNDSAGNGLTYSNPNVAVQADGSFFVTFIRDDGTNQDLVGRKFTSFGTQVDSEVVMREDGFSGSADNENIAEPDTIALANGGFATVYTENDTFGGFNRRTVELRLSNANGTNGALVNNISLPDDGDDDSGPRIVQLADNRLLIAWVESGDIRGRILNENGTSSVPEFNITNNTTLNFSTIDLVALEDGGYYTVFRDDTVGRLLGVRGFNGSQQGVTIIISNDADGVGGDIGDFSASLTTDGRILVSWENGEIYTEILDPRLFNTAITADPGDGQITDRQATDNTLNGSGLDDILYGLDGSDVLIGNNGNDTLDGGTGNDEMIGGLGNDTYFIDSIADIVTELPGQGTDRLNTAINLNPFGTRYANIEVFALIGSAIAIHTTDNGETIFANPTLGSRIFAYGGDDTINGSVGNDRIFAGSGNDTIFGGGGNDVIDGNAGADTMTGGAGNDNYFVDNLGDVVIEFADEGTDFVRSFVDFTLGENIELLRLALTASVGNGNALDNTIVTAGGAATLRGFDGNDNIRGSQFNDIIQGGRGNDTINGLSGADTIDGGSGDDEIKGSNGDDIIDGGTGNDTIFGGKDNDTITGGAGLDTMRGDIGADIFVFDDGHFSGLTASTADTITDFDQAENDTIDLSLVDAILGGGDDAFTFIGSGAFSGTAGEVRFEQSGGVTMIFMDTNGNGNANLAIALTGLINLTEADFIL
ncbi:calcium-binding protein [Erythrobacter sp. EC-HK427]|uniref:calcium-binding protein n=1 Tax=Erythrobacter sp. EC-HK427 TaxID=2038396 RepID=UPI00125C3D82|nr:calcium-binding protein [Erythrobacter sp. EC-HK427]VVT12632.1 putative Iron-regulated protein FrpC [Erythrobacter sp. EC-HK427]